MRIATWNVNGLRARLDYLRLWLKERQPDVVGLQEIKLTDEQFPALDLEAEGYHVAAFGQKAWNGVAILSKSEAKVTQRGLPGQEDRGARLITADVDGLSFTTVYVPNGKTVSHEEFPLKLDWLDALNAHVRERHDASEPTVLCGDLNLCPQPIDSWNEDLLGGSIFHTEEERARFRSMLDWGFKDLFRETHPDLQAFSWWDYRGGAFHRKQGLRIDITLGTQCVLDRMSAAEIDRDWRKKKDGLTASDHAPVVIDLD